MARFDDYFFSYGVDEFSLMEIDDDFVSRGELIEEGKYIIVVSFCPRVI